MNQDPSFFCDRMDLWAEACMTGLPTDSEFTKKWRQEFRTHWLWVRGAILKSNLLHRLFYGGEELRTEPCPVHKGTWSGCRLVSEMECGGICAYGHNVTGWIKNEGAKHEAIGGEAKGEASSGAPPEGD